MTADLITWLRARLDDDERIALALPESRRSWQADGASIVAGHPTDEVVDWVYDDGGWEHIARHDPARVLAEVDAKRRILDELTARRLDPAEPDGGWEAADAETDGMASAVVRALALPYADRPGYRPEWRP